MAIRAVLRRGFVKQDHLTLDLALQGMTLVTTHVGVSPGQRELGALIVVKGRWSPMLVDVAIRALG